MNTAGALEAVERILNRGGEPTDVLRAVLEALHDRGVPYAAVRLADRELIVGSIGEMPTTTSGPLSVALDDRAFVDRVATLITPYVR